MAIFKYRNKMSWTCLSEMELATEQKPMATLVSPLHKGRGNMNPHELKPIFDPSRQVVKMTPIVTAQTKVDWRLNCLLTSPSQLPNCLISISLAEAVMGCGTGILIRLTGKSVGQPVQNSISATFFAMTELDFSLYRCLQASLHPIPSGTSLGLHS